MRKAISYVALSAICFWTLSGLASDWPMLGHDPSRSGATSDELRPPFARKWYRMFPDEGIQSGVQPIIAGRKVFIGTLSGTLHAMDDDSGKDAWTFKAGGPILHSVAAHNAGVFFGSADGRIYALNARTGTLIWSFQTGSAVWNAPLVFSNLVICASRDGYVYALDTTSGEPRWTANAGAPLLNSPALDSKRGRVYIGSEAMRVHAYELSSGRPLWTSRQLPGLTMRGYHPVIMSMRWIYPH